jgi:hypothetical protein
MFKNTKLNKTYNFLLRFAIISASYGYIAYQLFYNDNYKQTYNLFKIVNQNKFAYLFLLFIIVLMCINWSIEALKWRYLIRKIEQISFAKALKAILAGLSVSTFTPNRIGEFLGRVFILQKANPWKAIFISILCSMSQLMITLLIGSISISVYILKFFIGNEIIPSYILFIFILLLVFINLIILAIFFNVAFISKLLDRLIIKKWRRIKGYFKVFSYFNFNELRNVLLFSLSRYMVFSFQFYLLLNFFNVPLNMVEGIFLISLIYFIISAIPSIALAEIGIRGSIAMGVIDYYFNTTLQMNVNFNIEVIAATSVLWLINIALPAFIGNLFVLKLNFFKEK